MRPGEVVTIRINPTDCMAVADIVSKSSMPTYDMSFASAVSFALGVGLATLRKAGYIPERTGFEYNEIMAPFAMKKRTKRKLEITNAYHIAGSDITMPAVDLQERRPEAMTRQTGSAQHVALTLPAIAVQDTDSQGFGLYTPGRNRMPPTDIDAESRAFAASRLQELIHKKEHVASEWNAADELEYRKMYFVIYGDL